MAARNVIIFVQSASKRTNPKLANRSDFYFCLIPISVTWISEHFDKPGFDERIKFVKLRFCNNNLLIHQRKFFHSLQLTLQWW